jgi:hypothetical protein
MRKIDLLVLGLIVLYLAGCVSGSNNGSSSSPVNTGFDDGESSTAGNPQGGVGGGNNAPIEINIPSRNESVPAGVLEQLSWGGQGGGDGPTFEQPCGGCDARLYKNSLSLSGFLSFQTLEIPIYRYLEGSCALGSAEYVTTLTVQADQNGNFESKLSGATEKLLLRSIYDSDTGEEVWFSFLTYKIEEYLDCSALDAAPKSCPGAPPQRLKVNEMAYVCTAGDTVKLRDGPDKDYPILKSLVPGADIKIIGGPTCADNWSWWQVETESGYVGWMSEGGDDIDTYFLCPRK